MAEKFQNINYDIDKLPSMPLITTWMVELINSPRASADAMAKVISGDLAILARVLKVANSSFYSMTCALGSRFLARSLCTGDPEEAFIAGLFRHIGRVVFKNRDSDTYRELVNLSSEFPNIRGIFGEAAPEMDLSSLPGAQGLGLDAGKIENLIEEFSEVGKGATFTIILPIQGEGEADG